MEAVAAKAKALVDAAAAEAKKAGGKVPTTGEQMDKYLMLLMSNYDRKAAEFDPTKPDEVAKKIAKVLGECVCVYYDTYDNAQKNKSLPLINGD